MFEALVEKGAGDPPPSSDTCCRADSISWPLRLLDRVAGKEQELEVLKAVLERHEPGYERDPTKKIQLLNHLAAVKDDRVPPLVVPYLADMDEGVRYAAVEALMRHKNEETAREPLLQHFVVRRRGQPAHPPADRRGLRRARAGWSKATAASSTRSSPSSSSWTAKATSRKSPMRRDERPEHAQTN